MKVHMDVQRVQNQGRAKVPKNLMVEKVFMNLRAPKLEFFSK